MNAAYRKREQLACYRRISADETPILQPRRVRCRRFPPPHFGPDDSAAAAAPALCRRPWGRRRWQVRLVVPPSLRSRLGMRDRVLRRLPLEATASCVTGDDGPSGATPQKSSSTSCAASRDGRQARRCCRACARRRRASSFSASHSTRCSLRRRPWCPHRQSRPRTCPRERPRPRCKM